MVSIKVSANGPQKRSGVFERLPFLPRQRCTFGPEVRSMRIPGMQGAGLILPVVLLGGLVFCPGVSAQTQSQSQPCPTPDTANTSAGGANNGAAAPNSVKDAAANAKTALKNLGSVFGKKKTPDAASTAPCTPATATSAPGSSSGVAPSAAPGAAQPANAPSQPAPAGQLAPAAAGGGDAVPFSPDSGSTIGGAATAGSAAAFASNAPPDFAKLPDIGGTLRVGLSPDQTGEAILKIHPEYKVIPLPDARATLRPLSRDGNPPLQGLRGTFYSDPVNLLDQFEAYFTMPPAKQQVFAVHRNYPYPAPGIDRVKLVAALRQKYGPETKAVHAFAGTPKGVGDELIQQMYWVYDEQGHVIPSNKDTSAPYDAPFGCLPIGDNVGDGTNVWGSMAGKYRLNTLPPASFCDTVVVLYVNLGGTSSQLDPNVGSTNTIIDDYALLRRDVQIAGDAAKAESQKQQQQQIDQSKQAKPTL
jgi:hypothetical protein